ncbi:hypothetical protein Agabi119p4_5073 [Agaricus bisporus var. burnettii]|uniref:ATP synthase subunit d, mitochondrial n=1 Tax=Agaricus bisporus var. burnettii TaxID=192524 RepID=A0A8H7F4K6_AGABI|nr:hypothetical protein Agabi119p4_5073 [Agaricus bisporus var. burnettii]
MGLLVSVEQSRRNLPARTHPKNYLPLHSPRQWQHKKLLPPRLISPASILLLVLGKKLLRRCKPSGRGTEMLNVSMPNMHPNPPLSTSLIIPVTYDVNAQVKAIEAFETKAVAKAQETEAKIDVELKELQATLANIEDARPFDELTTEDVGRAHPRIVEAVETMLKKGKWTVPGYKEKFGDLNLM